ncbi:MAG: calcium/sodium antiporter [Kiritimatiellae bacterium]|nr:calcium/sodium antiporter [Kiritimatiellia bacterium]
MYPELPLWLSIVCVLGGFAVLAWSSDAFVDGASAVAKAFGVSPFIIGMVIIGFGTSAPELCVSALSGATGHSDLSLGNAYGSCIFNIAVILGVAALIKPLVVKPSVVFVAVPALVAIAALSCLLVTLGGGFSRMDGAILLGVFAVLLPAYCWFDQSQKKKADADDGRDTRGTPPGEAAPRRFEAAADATIPLWKAWLLLFVGLAFLVGSSHVLVWGCVDLARKMGVSELLIGLTVVAVGTSLPELASAVASARKGEHEFVLGNIVGSNIFNTLAVVGLAGTISPFQNISPYLLTRDLPVMVLATVLIGVFGFNARAPREPKSVGRVAGGIWLLLFAVYMGLMLWQELK